MTKWICNKCMAGNPCSLDFIGTATPRKICPFTGTGIAEWRTEQKQKQETELPKLTAEVFERPDCPTSARWATVDEDGTAYFHFFAPLLYADEWQHTTDCKKIPGKWDATNWTEIIQRPEKKALPDWCKVGEWVYDPGIQKYFRIAKTQEYFRIAKIDEDFLFDECGGHVLYSYCKQARLRPWTKEEAIGRVVQNACCVGIITYADKFKCIVGTKVITLKELSEEYTEQDDAPCGKLEHLENGEWVE